LILYPYLRQPIHTLTWLELSEPCFDLIGAYGYGALLGQVGNAGLLSEVVAAFGEYCRSTGVVAEFVRINPLVSSKEAMAKYYELTLANVNVVVDLQRDDDLLWRSYKYNNRKNINKAIRSGVRIIREIVPAKHFGRFLEIYQDTLNRRGAKAYYRFPIKFYETMHEQMPESVVYFFAEHNGEIISCELCLKSETTIYSFLGGTNERRFEVRSNNLLKHELIRWARDQGLKYYLIGGGADIDDGIFEYKRSFAPQGIVDFHIAKKIHDQELYAKLLKRCEYHYPHNTDAARKWFLRWRYEEAN